ncbi:MAG: UbiD family decarboxylase [Candidatus Eisenbacteria bacterium]|nr:UbiD family decarboxylase [Candidatus Eisenbacteria bacterium]
MTDFRSLGEFLSFLDRRGDLKRVSREVDWAYEVTEIACREAKSEGPALLFENVKGAAFPLAVNMLAARRRIEWAIGRKASSVGDELESLFHAMPPKKLGDLWRLRGSARRVLAMRPRLIDAGPAQSKSLREGLASLPNLQLWPGDGGRFVTFPLVLTEHPVTRTRNLGIYRMHVFDDHTTGMHWQIGKGGGFHYHEAEKRGLALEVAVAVGADPATLLSAVAPLPEGIDELSFAGFLRGSPTRLARARTLSMRVPADAEFVIEGLVPAGERRGEGPFGDHFGHYSHAAPIPVFHVKSVTRRRRAVFQASVVGKPPQEDKYMGEAVQEMFTGVLRVIHPEIRDLWAYFEAGFHNLLVVAVENRFAKEGKKTALGLMGTGQLSLTKAIVLVDADVNPRDRAAVFGEIARHFDPAEDFMLLPGVPLDTLDFTSYTMNLGSKMVIDAQSHARAAGSAGVMPAAARSAEGAASVAPRPGAATGAAPAAPPAGSGDGLAPVTPSPRSSVLADPRSFDETVIAHRLAWGGMLVVQVKGEGRAILERLIQRPEYAGVTLLVVVSADVPLDDDELLLWGIFTRFDCARDVVPAHTESRGAWLTCRGPLGIDATWKNGYPKTVENLPAMIQHVNAWWGNG